MLCITRVYMVADRLISPIVFIYFANKLYHVIVILQLV